jgi:hypothetical protein
VNIFLGKSLENKPMREIYPLKSSMVEGRGKERGLYLSNLELKVKF